MSASASGASASNGNARNRDHNQGNQERKYTAEQKAAVLRIRACKATAFYEILAIEKTCSDAEVKKAYRKQSLLTHPDKNGHPNADEAFKMVSRAFSVLGDKDKRDKFDRFGTDPDSRFESARQQQNPFAGGGFGGGGGGGRGGGWEQEMSPEEMFARFFGGGGGGFGGPFGGGEFMMRLEIGVRTRLTCGYRLRRRTTIRLQLWRRTWSQSTSIWRRKTKTTTERSEPARTRTNAGKHHYGLPTHHPHSHISHPILHLWRRRFNASCTTHVLRVPTAAKLYERTAHAQHPSELLY